MIGQRVQEEPQTGLFKKTASGSFFGERAPHGTKFTYGGERMASVSPAQTAVKGAARGGVGVEPEPLGAACEPRSGEPCHYANNSSSIKKSVTLREERYALRDGLREFTTLPRVRNCGRKRVSEVVSLRADADGQRVGYGNVETCGSVWACPVCAAKISARRKTELEQVVNHALEHGMQVSMLTLTERHHKGDDPVALWDALSYAWGRVTSGRKWQQFKEQLGLVGYVKAVEVTHGKHGWHIHQHVLIISERSPEEPLFFQRKRGRAKRPYPVEVVAPIDFVSERWAAALASKGVDFIAAAGGADWEVARDPWQVARYVAKMGFEEGNAAANRAGAHRISKEVTLGGFKKAREGNRTPFQILADAYATGDADDVALWNWYEQFSHGRRALTWSYGLREWAGLGAEQTDEEIAAESEGDEVIALISADGWKVLQPQAARLLTVLQLHGRQAAYEWMDSHGVEYCRVSAPPDVG